MRIITPDTTIVYTGDVARLHEADIDTANLPKSQHHLNLINH